MPLKKIATVGVAEVVKLAKLSAEAGALEAGDATTFLQELMRRELFLDAVRFLAHALPKREAVWWACTCVREALAPDAAPAALEAAEKWVYQPTEENRRAAMTQAEAAGFDRPASWTAVAAFWSGGSMAPPNAPVVPPGEALTGAAASGAILLSAVEREPQHAPERYRRFLAAGIDIADGGSGRKRQASA